MIDDRFIKEKIDNAQLVLVGIGEEFDGRCFLQKIPRYICIEEELKATPQLIWILPYVQYFFLKDNERLLHAFRALNELLKNKNYFLVTTCMNGLIDDVGLKEGRVVSPCGSFRKMQCSSPTCDHIEVTASELLAQMDLYIQGEITLNQIEFIRCSKCGELLHFNSLYSENYKESGYLDDWAIYTKWLQGTLNKQIYVIELGVSLQFPSVIRFPFEKIAFFNQKADFIRIHENLYQLSEELKGKGYSQAENAVEFLNHIP